MTSSQMPSPIAMPCPFANPLSGTQPTVTDIVTTASPGESVVSFNRGFGTDYAAPASAGGKYVTRAEMNGFGKALGVDTFRMKAGGLNTFDPLFAAAIGGYHKGAVLDYVADGVLYKVISLVDNNMVDFNGIGGNGTTAGSVDLVNWKFISFKQEDPIGNVEVFPINNFPAVSLTSYNYIGAFVASKSGLVNVTGTGTWTFNPATVSSNYMAGCAVLVSSNMSANPSSTKFDMAWVYGNVNTSTSSFSYANSDCHAFNVVLGTSYQVFLLTQGSSNRSIALSDSTYKIVIS